MVDHDTVWQVQNYAKIEIDSITMDNITYERDMESMLILTGKGKISKRESNAKYVHILLRTNGLVSKEVWKSSIILMRWETIAKHREVHNKIVKHFIWEEKHFITGGTIKTGEVLIKKQENSKREEAMHCSSDNTLGNSVEEESVQWSESTLETTKIYLNPRGVYTAARKE